METVMLMLLYTPCWPKAGPAPCPGWPNRLQHIMAESRRARGPPASRASPNTTCAEATADLFTCCWRCLRLASFLRPLAGNQGAGLAEAEGSVAWRSEATTAGWSGSSQTGKGAPAGPELRNGTERRIYFQILVKSCA